MKNIIIVGMVSLGSLVLVGCGAGAGPKSSNAGGSSRQTLQASGDCEFEVCGEVPSSMRGAAKLECGPNNTKTCGWSPTEGSTPVSYRVCREEECSGKPEIACPADSVQTQQCGSEDDGACQWTTVCTPPRVTTACADQHGCDKLPVLEIAVICEDGSAGGFACVTDDGSCFWERNCD